MGHPVCCVLHIFSKKREKFFPFWLLEKKERETFFFLKLTTAKIPKQTECRNDFWGVIYYLKFVN